MSIHCDLWCRPLKHEGAYVLFTAQLDANGKDKILLSMQPQDMADATLEIVTTSTDLATVPIDPVKVSLACQRLSSCAVWRYQAVRVNDLCQGKGSKGFSTKLQQCFSQGELDTSG